MLPALSKMQTQSVPRHAEGKATAVRLVRLPAGTGILLFAIMSVLQMIDVSITAILSQLLEIRRHFQLLSTE